VTAGKPAAPSWEDVLSAVEQDVRRTEAFLVLAAADLTDPAEAEAAAMAKRLMTSAAADLPPLALMPLVPPTLLERVTSLRERISEIRAELEAAMTANREKLAETTSVTRPPVPGYRARYVDTVA
jgi:hypothetical protein